MPYLLRRQSADPIVYNNWISTLLRVNQIGAHIVMHMATLFSSLVLNGEANLLITTLE